MKIILPAKLSYRGKLGNFLYFPDEYQLALCIDYVSPDHFRTRQLKRFTSKQS